MKAVILAGGVGTRLSEETGVRPKPMVEIGGKPILWHIMKIYSSHGINDFVIAAGYKGNIIKEYFASYFLRMADITIDLAENEIDGPPVGRGAVARDDRGYGRRDDDRRPPQAGRGLTSTARPSA